MRRRVANMRGRRAIGSEKALALVGPWASSEVGGTGPPLLHQHELRLTKGAYLFPLTCVSHVSL